MRWLKALAGEEAARKLTKYQTELRREGRKAEPGMTLRQRFSIITSVRDRGLQAFWAMHVDAMNWSGMGVREYAAALSLSPYALRKWRDRLDAGELEIDWRAHLHPSTRPVVSTSAKESSSESSLREPSNDAPPTTTIVQALHSWLATQLPLVSGRSTLAEAIPYALSRWKGLTRFLHDGLELDTNPVERAIRPVALGRKNHLFPGSDGGGHRWAVACSLIATCKLNDVELYVYLRDVLQRMVDGYPVKRLDELLPWNWRSQGAAATTVWAKPDARQMGNPGPQAIAMVVFCNDIA